MLSSADSKSPLVLVLSVVVIILVCGVFAIDMFNRSTFHQSSYDLVTNPQAVLNK